MAEEKIEQINKEMENLKLFIHELVEQGTSKRLALKIIIREVWGSEVTNEKMVKAN